MPPDLLAFRSAHALVCRIEPTAAASGLFALTMHTSSKRALLRNMPSQTRQDKVNPCINTRHGFVLSPTNSAWTCVPSLDYRVLDRGLNDILDEGCSTIRREVDERWCAWAVLSHPLLPIVGRRFEFGGKRRCSRVLFLFRTCSKNERGKPDYRGHRRCRQTLTCLVTEGTLCPCFTATTLARLEGKNRCPMLRTSTS